MEAWLDQTQELEEGVPLRRRKRRTSIQLGSHLDNIRFGTFLLTRFGLKAMFGNVLLQKQVSQPKSSARRI